MEVLVKFKWRIPINPIILLPIPSEFSSSHASGYAISSNNIVAYERVTLTLIHPWAGAEEALFISVAEAAEEALGIEIGTRIIRSEDLITLLPTQWGTYPKNCDVMKAARSQRRWYPAFNQEKRGNG